jgi:hypothetical protein
VKEYDDIIRSEPIDRLASRVTLKGNNYTYKKTSNIFFEFCPPIDKFPGPKEHDLTGKRFGRLVVIGYTHWRLYKKKRDRPGRWVVRCDCGIYEIRRSVGLKKLNNTLCCKCQQLEHIRNKPSQRTKLILKKRRRRNRNAATT